MAALNGVEFEPPQAGVCYLSFFDPASNDAGFLMSETRKILFFSEQALPQGRQISESDGV